MQYLHATRSLLAKPPHVFDRLFQENLVPREYHVLAPDYTLTAGHVFDQLIAEKEQASL